MKRRTFLAGATTLVLASAARLGIGTKLASAGRSTPMVAEETDSLAARTKRILVTYATRCGSTAEIANAVAEQMSAGRCTVDILPIKDVKDVRGYDAVVIGSAVRMGRLLSEARKRPAKWAADLAAIPTAYFCVSMTMQDDTPESRAEAQAFLQPLAEIREPVATGLFAGAIDHEQLSPLLRFFAKSAETLSECDHRDWNAIQAWADTTADVLLTA